MHRIRLNPVKTSIFAAFMLCNYTTAALEFEPGIGVGLEYTDNATLSADNPVDDLIAIGYLGGSLVQTDGPLRADISAGLDFHRYTQDTFDDNKYFNLNASADWEMVQDRFDWLVRDFYGQRLINTVDPNTPDNIQDSNIFVFAADMFLPVTGRQTITVLPEYRNFYYEFQSTDNQQLSLTGNWDYKLSPLTTVGATGYIRAVEYDEATINDVTFSSVFFTLKSQRVNSDFSTNLGFTDVDRENGQTTEEFAGNLDWVFKFSELSKLRTYMSTDLTDTSSGVLRGTDDPGTGDPNDIQISTDVIRNKVVALEFTRKDRALESTLTGQIRDLNYSESPNDRSIVALRAALNYLVTETFSSGLYARFSNTEFTDIVRTDDNITVGALANYRFTRKLNGTFDLKYRNRDSTLQTQDFDEWSAYVNLVYGFGQPLRPTRVGEF